MREPVGFIGLGAMGAAIAGRLCETGLRLAVLDRDPVRMAPFLARGAVPAATPRELAVAAPILLACLPTPEALRAVALGPEGVAAGPPGRLLVDLSTSGPEAAREVAEDLAARGIGFVDAPVSGGLAGARAGSLVVMAAGAAGDLARARAVLETLGSRIVVAGERPGQGQAMKLVNNQLSLVAIVATAEALLAGAQAGLDPAAMLEAINGGTGRNSATAEKFPRAVLTGRFDHGFTNAGAAKDLSLALAQAEAGGVAAPIAAAALAAWRRAIAEEGPEADFTTVVRMLEREAGLALRAPR